MSCVMVAHSCPRRLHAGARLPATRHECDRVRVVHGALLRPAAGCGAGARGGDPASRRLFEERYSPRVATTRHAQRVKLAQALVHDPRIRSWTSRRMVSIPRAATRCSRSPSAGREFGSRCSCRRPCWASWKRICDGVLLVEQGRLVRAERLGTLTGKTGTLIVEIDGDAAPLQRAWSPAVSSCSRSGSAS